MKQKFTSEKNKYLENKNLKNETMFNFKISCLMKKQFNYLMMVLAMVILAGTSAMAQNSDQNADTHFTGSEHTYSVTDLSTSTEYAWTILDVTGAGTSADPYISAAPTAATNYTGLSGEATRSVTFTWSESASGVFCIQLSESNLAVRGGCATVREFFVLVIDFDLHLFASDASGTEISDADTTTCGSNSSYNPFFNTELDLRDNIDMADGSVSLPYSTRHVTATLTASTGISLAATSYRWQFPYTLADADDVYDVDIISANTEVAVTYTNFESGIITVDSIATGGTVTSITLEIRYQPKWDNAATDITLKMSNAQNTCVLDGKDADELFDDGAESTANYGVTPGSADPLSNSTRQQVIWASPATTPIVISD
jgi:hypothetical protein